MSQKSDAWRDQEAQRVNDVLEQFKECVSPETLEANEDAWDNTISGNDASTDESLNEPNP